jgi:hypothetical protein
MAECCFSQRYTDETAPGSLTFTPAHARWIINDYFRENPSKRIMEIANDW